jgi:toxin-antitoxin system PIN domain toxin
MFLLDANILIYSFRRDLPQHALAKRWLERTLTESEPLALLPFTELAFLRITTNLRVFTEPSQPEEAIRFLDSVRSCPVLTELHLGPDHRSIFVRLVREHHLAGNDLSDAFIAAAAIESAATLVSADRGFARFRGLRWVNPLKEHNH